MTPTPTPRPPRRRLIAAGATLLAVFAGALTLPGAAAQAAPEAEPTVVVTGETVRDNVNPTIVPREADDERQEKSA